MMRHIALGCITVATLTLGTHAFQIDPRDYPDTAGVINLLDKRGDINWTVEESGARWTFIPEPQWEAAHQEEAARLKGVRERSGTNEKRTFTDEPVLGGFATDGSTTTDLELRAPIKKTGTGAVKDANNKNHWVEYYCEQPKNHAIHVPVAIIVKLICDGIQSMMISAARGQ